MGRKEENCAVTPGHQQVRFPENCCTTKRTQTDWQSVSPHLNEGRLIFSQRIHFDSVPWCFWRFTRSVLWRMDLLCLDRDNMLFSFVTARNGSRLFSQIPLWPFAGSILLQGYALLFARRKRHNICTLLFCRAVLAWLCLLAFIWGRLIKAVHVLRHDGLQFIHLYLRFHFLPLPPPWLLLNSARGPGCLSRWTSDIKPCSCARWSRGCCCSDSACFFRSDRGVWCLYAVGWFRHGPFWLGHDGRRLVLQRPWWEDKTKGGVRLPVRETQSLNICCGSVKSQLVSKNLKN